jgi:SAM-dependent methyltransferase
MKAASIVSPESGAAVESPLAPGAAVEVIARLDVAELRRKWRERLGIELDDDFPSTGELPVYRCTRSDLRFFRPATLEGKASLYESLQRLQWYYGSERWDFERAAEDVAGCRTLVEIGCGTGQFLALLAARHPGISVSGVELNPRAAEQATRRGFQVHCRPVSEVASELAGRFDAVCAFQVLEHVADIRDFLESCIALLAPGGKLIFSVPNARGYLEHDDEILDSPPHHMSRWSAETFRFLPSRFPLHLERIRYQPLSSGEIAKYCRSRQTSWSKAGGQPKDRSASDFAYRAMTRVLRLGLYRFCKGHSLYAVLQRAQDRTERP